MPSDTVPVLSADERADYAEDHQCHPDSRGTARETCWGCGKHWPCPVARLLATCAELERERDAAFADATAAVAALLESKTSKEATDG